MARANAHAHALSDHEYQILTEHSPVMIWRSGSDGLCDYFNETWLDFTGRSFEHELGNGWADGVFPEDLAGCLATYLSSFERRVPFEMRYRLRRRDGAYRYILDHGVPFFGENGAFAGFIGSCIDVQDAHTGQLAMKAQEQQALATTDAIQRRIGRDLHDGLGQLLTGISFVAKEIEGAADGAIKVRAKRLVELIEKSVEHAHNLARGLAPMHLETTTLEQALEELASETSNTNDITCTLSCGAGSVDMDVGARTQLFLITQEAIANALRHGGAKQIAIELETTERAHHLRIMDDGRGMRLPPASRGLGLASMAQRARLLGGVLEIEPAAQGGIEVRCTW